MTNTKVKEIYLKNIIRMKLPQPSLTSQNIMGKIDKARTIDSIPGTLTYIDVPRDKIL